MVVDINLTPTASFVDISRAKSHSSAVSADTPDLLPARSWGTSGECVAGAVLVHGLGAHSGWFEALGRRLKVRRIYALAYDQVGFGRRRGEKFTSYRQWLDDLNTAFDYARTVVGDKPLYIMGNSMGAAVALRAVSNGDLKPKGLVMFSPGFEGHSSVFTLPFKVTALWRAITDPEFEIALPYSTDLVTRDVAVRHWLKSDPERRFTVSARMLLELLKLTKDLPSLSKKLKCPVLLLSAGVDKIVNMNVSTRLFGNLTCPKEQKIFPEAWHDLMFDPVIDEVADDLLRWIRETNYWST